MARQLRDETWETEDDIEECSKSFGGDLLWEWPVWQGVRQVSPFGGLDIRRHQPRTLLSSGFLLMALKVLTVVGVRPQFIKAAAVSRALREHGGIQEILVHTGQHFDQAMSGVFFEELELPSPAYNLEVNSVRHGAMTGRMLEKLEDVMVQERPEWVLVYGDTNSTVAGALAAAKLHIPVAHVEAGTRSYNRRMAEEVNRVVADHVSSLLLCPTQTAVANLTREGIVEGVHHVGDVMYDVAQAAVAKAEARSRILEALQLSRGAYAVATVHRAENTDDPDRFARVMAWLSQQGEHCPIVMPVHPRTRKLIDSLGLTPLNIRLIEPLGYLDMAWLTHNAVAVFTDSGGLQKEAYFHRVPCVTLRDDTECVETIEAGWNRLWTVDKYQPRGEIAGFSAGDSSRKVAELLGQAAS